MGPTRLFRLSVVVGLVAYLAYWFLPYSYGYLDSETGSLLSYAGYGAIYSGSYTVSVVLLAGWIASAAGMFFYKKAGRTLFLVLLIVTTAMTPLYGMSIELAGGAMLLDVTNIADGFALGLAYFSPAVKSKFDRV